jgi:hypothetical protein
MMKKEVRKMEIFRPIILVFGLGTLFVMMSGCSSGTKYPVVPVEGKIALANGNKLPVGTRVVLEPTEGRVGAAMGATMEDGSFRTIHVINGANGAEEGAYLVKLLPPEGNSAEFEKVVPKKYQGEFFTSAEVKAGMPPLNLKLPAAP